MEGQDDERIRAPGASTCTAWLRPGSVAGKAARRAGQPPVSHFELWREARPTSACRRRPSRRLIGLRRSAQATVVGLVRSRGRLRLARTAVVAGLLLLALPARAAAHGDSIASSDLSSAWDAAPVVLAGFALALGLFTSAFVRLRRRGRADRAPATRPLLFLLGSGLMLLALVSPLDAIGEEYLLSGHMFQHVLLADAGPALVLAAVRGPLTFFLLPPLILRRLAPVRPLRSFFAFLLRPRVSFALWAVVIALWHVPAAYGAALASKPLHDLEHATFVLVGILVWAQLVDPARRRALSIGGRIGFAFLLFACGQALADVLIFSFEPLYGAYAAQDERLLGLLPRLDQQLAGLVMMVEQTLSLGTSIALLLVARERESVRAAAEAEGRTGRSRVELQPR
jgi:putative membrane protein